MSTPFPGMDPYLERKGLWEQVHTALIVDIQKYLARLLRPRYRVEVERRTYLAMSSQDDEKFAGKPDVLIVSPTSGLLNNATLATATPVQPYVAELPMPEKMIERYLKIRDDATRDVITVIEILSPANKRTRKGRQEYNDKRIKILASSTNLVEIDLLRSGRPLPFSLRNNRPNSDYRIVVSRAHRRPSADVYMFGIRHPIPDIPVPLRQDEVEPILSLNQLLHDLYDDVGYDLAIDYKNPPIPRLTGQDAQWAKELLHNYLNRE